MNSSAQDRASTLFRTLSSPLRVGIILALDEAPSTVSALVDRLDASQPLVSQHLRVLRDTCLVTAERRGREITYSLMDHHVAHIVRDAVDHATEHDPSLPAQEHTRKDPA